MIEVIKTAGIICLYGGLIISVALIAYVIGVYYLASKDVKKEHDEAKKDHLYKRTETPLFSSGLSEEYSEQNIVDPTLN